MEESKFLLKHYERMDWNFNMVENRKQDSDIKEKLVAINRITNMLYFTLK